ncbi:MAG: hypothetical protein ACYSTT_02665 [Planctomycetota bacterium]|jgi:hypothetical protein
MSQINENEIHDRLKRLSQVEPGQEAADRAMQKARDALIASGGRRVRLVPPSLINGLMKLAAAAVLMIGAGFIGGRLSAPEPLDLRELTVAIESSLKSSLEPAIRRQLLDDIEDRLQLASTADRDMLKQELAQLVRRDLELFAEQTLTTVGNLTDQRLMEFARMLEAARIKERRHVAAAFDYMGSRFGNGLVTLAAQRSNLSGPERTGSVPDISEN